MIKEDWERLLEESNRKMKDLWPQILHYRSILKAKERIHRDYQTKALEAQRHLIGIPTRKDKRKLFKKVRGLVNIASTLNREDLDHLIRIFEMPDESVEELRKVAREN